MTNRAKAWTRKAAEVSRRIPPTQRIGSQGEKGVSKRQPVIQ
jgi:hypothetical protein